MPDSDRKRQSWALIRDAILLEARRGRGDWQWLFDELYFVLPEEFRADFWFELAQSPGLGHAPQMLAHKAEHLEPLPSRVKDDQKPELDGPALKAAQYLLDHPFAGPAELAKAVGGKIKRSQGAYWKTKHKGVQQWLAIARRKRAASIWKREIEQQTARLAQYFAEPFGTERETDFLLVAAHDLQNPSSTAEAVEKATGIPASLVCIWRRAPQFEAALTRIRAQ
jgi:hypothetical protein